MFVVLCLVLKGGATFAGPLRTVLVEAEAFDELGGWVVDTQVMPQMGSPFLMAQFQRVDTRGERFEGYFGHVRLALAMLFVGIGYRSRASQRRYAGSA
jgi:hypothetical protein